MNLCNSEARSDEGRAVCSTGSWYCLPVHVRCDCLKLELLRQVCAKGKAPSPGWTCGEWLGCRFLWVTVLTIEY